MTNITVETYLARIGVTERPRKDLSGLTLLMQAHLSAVPFENIDVFRQTGVRTDIDWSLAKIVLNDRGGWCFENNGSFGWLLREIGFDTTYLGAYVLLPPPDTEHMSHLCLRVELDKPYLVDVGFGDSFNRPLPLETDSPFSDGNETYVLSQHGEYLVLAAGSPPSPQYRFTLDARSLEEFEEQSVRLQKQGVSSFTEKPFATRLIDGGPDRVTLLQDRIRFRRSGTWTQREVPADDWNTTAKKWFGLEVD
jgi:N-hydroxyarylamine O-acetyltransferase